MQIVLLKRFLGVKGAPFKVYKGDCITEVLLGGYRGAFLGIQGRLYY